MSTRRKRPGRSDPIPESPVDEEGNPIYAGPSRSQLRREASAVSDVALRLTRLSPARLAQLPLDEELREAVDLAGRLTKNAHARHLRLIAKLLRDLPDEIRAEIEHLTSPHYRPGATPEERMAERWRTRLLAEGDAALNELVAEVPGVDRQHLRQLLRQARAEPPTDRSKRAARELLRAIRASLLSVTPPDVASDDAEPDDAVLEDAALDGTAEDAALDDTAPDAATPDAAASDDPRLENSAPEETDPEGPAPGDDEP